MGEGGTGANERLSKWCTLAHPIFSPLLFIRKEVTNFELHSY